MRLPFCEGCRSMLRSILGAARTVKSCDESVSSSGQEADAILIQCASSSAYPKLGRLVPYRVGSYYWPVRQGRTGSPREQSGTGQWIMWTLSNQTVSRFSISSRPHRSRLFDRDWPPLIPQARRTVSAQRALTREAL